MKEGFTSIAVSVAVATLIALGVTLTLGNQPRSTQGTTIQPAVVTPMPTAEMTTKKDNSDTHPLQITEMRKKEYTGSQIEIEETLTPNSTYSQYVASYEADGIKIFGLLTIPNGEKPSGGFPAIIFNHGYIPPEEYKTTEKYESYLDGFAREGFVVFKPDYRGHGNSEGEPLGTYFSPAYTEDVLYAFSAVQNMQNVNEDRVGMWGHSMGGHITLRSMVINPEIKAGVIWAGVTVSYEEMAEDWTRQTPWQPSPKEQASDRPSRSDLIKVFGDFEENPSFWESIAPINFIDDISGPIQLHHGTGDTTVPWTFSESLNFALTMANKEVEFYTYEGGDHNLSGRAFPEALSKSVEFFKKYL